MFVTIEAKALARAMKIVNAVIEKRNTIPILNAVRISYGASGLSIEGTDLDLSIKLKIDEIDGAGEFQVCVNSIQFAAIVSAAGMDTIRIEPTMRKIPKGAGPADNGDFYERPGLVICSGQASYEVDTQEPADFPEITGTRAGRIERFTNGMLTASLRKVAWCISTEETRYYLNGVCWSAGDLGMRLSATDGHRLAICRYAGNEAKSDFKRIIPRKTVKFLMQFFDGEDIDIHQISNGNAPADMVIDIVAPGAEIRSKLIDGTFPDVERVIPKSAEHAIELKRDEVLSAIRQATAISTERGRAIRMHNIDGLLHIETKNPDFGTAKVKTSTAWPEDAPAFGFNGRYMSEVISNCQGAVTLGMTDAGSPFLITDDDKDMTRVVMPMRV